MKELIFFVSALVLTAILFFRAPGAWSDEDEKPSKPAAHQMHAKTDVIAVTDVLYRRECGTCHMAYSPGLLPSASWRSMMQGLKDHFGDTAELDQTDMLDIETYLTANAAEKSSYRLSRAFMASMHAANGPVVRITEVPYFKREHREISQHLWQTPGMVSMSQCDSCHSNADKGVFSEQEIRLKDRLAESN